MSGLRVLILRANHGNGPGRATADVAAQLLERPEIDSVDWVEGLSVPQSGLAELIRSLLPGRAGRLAGLAMGHRSLSRTIGPYRPHVVVAEDLALSSELAQLKALGRFPVPLVVVIPDGADPVHWAHPAVDSYLLSAAGSVEEVERIAGAGAAAVIGPPIDSRFIDAPAHGSSRGWVARQLKVSLKGGRPLILVTGGGDLIDATATAVDAAPEAVVVAIAGEDAAAKTTLSARFADADQVRVLGETDRLSTLLAAADALIDTDGTTLVGARLVGCPSVAHPTADLAGTLQAMLEADRPAPEPVSGLPTAADVVVSVAYGS